MLGAPFAMTAMKSIEESGSQAKLVAFDMNKDVVAQIKADKITWAVDQQPYLQGYLAVNQLYLYKRNGNIMGAGQLSLTGPTFVDKTNVDTILPFIEQNTR